MHQAMYELNMQFILELSLNEIIFIILEKGGYMLLNEFICIYAVF